MKKARSTASGDKLGLLNLDKVDVQLRKEPGNFAKEFGSDKVL